MSAVDDLRAKCKELGITVRSNSITPGADPEAVAAQMLKVLEAGERGEWVFVDDLDED